MVRYMLPSWLAIIAIAYALLFGIRENVNEVPEVPHPHTLELITSESAAIDKLATLITFPTLANIDADNHISNPAPFQHLHDYMLRAYPAVFQTAKVEKVSDYSLLITWQGTDPTLDPIILMSHMDVVPASEPSSASAKWTHPPFSGTLSEGFIWGRGSMDTKLTLAGIVEAACQLMGQGFTPKRTLMLAFGHDEEVGGEYGAHAIVELLKSRGISPEMVLDEGGFLLTDGLTANNIKIVDRPIALIGTGEKGFQTWIIHVTGAGGHSSIPPTGKGTSVAARMSRVIAALEKEQTSTRLVAPVSDWLKALAPYTRWAPLRLLLSYADSPFLSPLLSQALGAAGGELSAMVRSTVAIVGVEAGGGAHNVLPGEGKIIVNVRVLNGDDQSTIQRYLNAVVHKEKEFVRIEPASGPMYNASPVSPARGPLFELLERVILETLWTPETKTTSTRKSDGSDRSSLPPAVVPYLVTGMTDSRWYVHGDGIAAGKVFRFSPMSCNRTSGDLNRIHGVDERIGMEGYLQAVRFYMRFMRLAAGDV